MLKFFFVICLFVICLGGSAVAASPVLPNVFEPGASPGEFQSRSGARMLRLNRLGIEFIEKNKPAIRMTLRGTRRFEPQGARLQPSTTNYLLGKDPSHWRTAVPNFGEVRYRGVYPGIDLSVHAAGKSFEYDFLDAAHADPSRISIRFEGASNVSLDKQGDLRMDDRVIQRRPHVLQGSAEIQGGFRLHPDGSVSLDLGPYDHARPLTIDPVITYASYVGGSRADSGQAVAVDASGSVYVAGSTDSTDFPGVDPASSRPGLDYFAFVSKFVPLGNGQMKLLYTTLLGDNQYGETSANAVAIDSSSNVILAGYSNSPGFPTTKNAIPTVPVVDCFSCYTAFLTKLAPDGRSIVFSTLYGGNGFSYFTALATDTNLDVYATGYVTTRTGLPGTAGAIQPMPGVGTNMMTAGFGPSGNLLYGTYLGSTGVAQANSIAVEKPGVVWIGGAVDSDNMPFVPGKTGVQRMFTGDMAAYVARIDMDQSGTSGLTYTSYFNGPTGSTALEHLFLDRNGQVVFCGATNSPNISLTPTHMEDYVGGRQDRPLVNFGVPGGDGFIARFLPSIAGSAGLTYASYIGGSDSDAAVDCAEDSQGNLVVTGRTYSNDFFFSPGSPIPLPQLEPPSDYWEHVFLTRIDTGTAGGKVDSLLFGGELSDIVYAMAIDSHGYAYLTGETYSVDFPTTAFALQPGPSINDGWLTQIDLNAPAIPVDGVALESGDFQFGARGARLSAPIAVHLIDASGNPLNLPGYTVNFAGDGALIFPGSAVSNRIGVASTMIQLDPSADAATVQASVQGGSQTYTFHLKTIAGALPQSVAILSGGGQSGPSGSTLPQPLVVQLRDANNAALPMTGIPVQFKPTNSSVSSAVVATDSGGLASTQVTLGKLAGPSSVVGSVGSLPAVTANFTVTPVLRSPGGVVSAATFLEGGVSPGLIVTLFGTGIGPAVLASNTAGPDGKFSTMLAGTQVLFDGFAAPLIYASSTPTSALVPHEVAQQTQTQVRLVYQGVASLPQTVAVLPAQLGLFSANSKGSGQGAVLNQNNSFNSSANPAKRGEIVVLYGTGEGQTAPPGMDGQTAIATYPKPATPISVKIGGRDAEVLYYGAAPGLVAGVLQINVRIPSAIPDGDATVQILEGSAQSPAVITIAVKGDQAP